MGEQGVALTRFHSYILLLVHDLRITIVTFECERGFRAHVPPTK